MSDEIIENTLFDDLEYFYWTNLIWEIPIVLEFHIKLNHKIFLLHLGRFHYQKIGINHKAR